MLAKIRRDKIFEIIKTDGAVDVSYLVEKFAVSIETIRKDLLFMEQNGQLKRVHGGAVKIGEMKQFGSLKYRNEENTSLKHELSLKAIELIEEGDIIAIDSGSTAIVFSEELKKRFKNLTIVTYCRDVFEMLCDYEDFNVILCAGHYLKGENAFYGDFVINTLNQIHVKKAFVFTSGVSLQYGIFDFQKELYTIQKTMLQCADKVYILADSSKFEKTGFLKLCEMREDYTYITDNCLSAELKNLYLKNGFNVL